MKNFSLSRSTSSRLPILAGLLLGLPPLIHGAEPASPPTQALPGKASTPKPPASAAATKAQVKSPQPAGSSLRQLPVITLEEALKSALTRHSRIIQADGDLQVRLSESLAARTLPNPVLETELASIGGAFGFEVRLSQPLRTSYFGMRRAYSAAMDASASADRQAVTVEVLNSALSAYYAVFSLQRQAEALQTNLTEASEIGSQLRTAVLAGQADNFATPVFDAEIAKTRSRIATLQARLANAREQFAASIGQPGKVWQVADVAILPLPDNTRALEDLALRRAPLRQALARREQLALQKLGLAEKDRYGEFSPQIIAGHKRDEGTTLGVGFSIQLPFFDANQPAINAARAELRQTRRELALMSPENIRRTVSIRWQAARDLAEAANIQGKDVVPALEKARQATLQSIAAGQANVDQLWQIQRELGTARIEALEADASALEARARLEEVLSGRVEEAIPSASGRSTRSSRAKTAGKSSR